MHGRAAAAGVLSVIALAAAVVAVAAVHYFRPLAGAEARLDDVSALTMPVRILCGTRTRRTAKRVCELLAQRIPGALVHWLDGLKHMAPITDAAMVSTVIADLVRCDPVLLSKVA